MAIGYGYPIAAEAFDLEVFKLACSFAASRELARLGEEHKSLDALRGTFEQSEAARRLIAVAVMVRSKIDARSVIRPARLTEISSMNVGELTSDLARPMHKCSLPFREACNKIIHAASLDLAPESETSESGVLSMKVTLWGTKRDGEIEWQAELDLPRFLEAASCL